MMPLQKPFSSELATPFDVILLVPVYCPAGRAVVDIQFSVAGARVLTVGLYGKLLV